ncbi:MAG: hypothetical protein ACRCS7_03640 [Tannerellaceae bacterium]
MKNSEIKIVKQIETPSIDTPKIENMEEFNFEELNEIIGGANDENGNENLGDGDKGSGGGFICWC